MTTEIQTYQPEKRIRSEDKEGKPLCVEIWENDNTIISMEYNHRNGESEFEFELSKKDAIRIAKTILAAYDA